MFLMMAEVLNVGRVARAFPQSGFWQFLAHQTDHVDWTGCSLHDLIQPGFSFLVGVALPYSIASRRAKGQTAWIMTGHAVWRSLVLVFLGIFLRSAGNRPHLNFTFEDTLTQIGLGYFFLFALGFRQVRDQWIAFGMIAVGYWAAFALWPLSPPDFNYAAVGVPPDWLAAHGLNGFAAHWQKNGNVAWAFDTWFLNLFAREKPFLFNDGGYATLSFIPTLGTMILGLIAGHVLHRDLPPAAKVRRFAVAGAIGLAAGAALGWFGVCPVVKRIWTPAWTLYSGGWCFLLLAGFYLVIDVWKIRRWAFPLVVVGMNSIAAYLIAHLFESFIRKSLLTHLGAGVFRVFGPAVTPLLQGGATLAVMWLLLWWMHRHKLFLKI